MKPPCHLAIFRSINKPFTGSGIFLTLWYITNWRVVLPMQKPNPDKPWLLEICPTSTLKQMDLYYPYKGRDIDRGQSREHILEQIDKRYPLSIPDSCLRQRILNDNEGDALDSVIAAYATFRALQNPRGLIPTGDVYKLEGFIYV